MLAKELKELADLDPNGEWIFQAKIDGVRGQLHIDKDNIQLFDRRGKDISGNFPEIIEQARAFHFDKPIILDGELCCVSHLIADFFYQVDFSAIQTRTHTQTKAKIKIQSKWLSASFIVFDIVDTEHTQEERLKELDLIIPITLPFHPKGIFKIRSMKGSRPTGEMLFNLAKQHKCEGIMVKQPDAPYEATRSEAWKKLKTYETRDCVAIGFKSKMRQISAIMTEEGDVNFTGQPKEIEEAILALEVYRTAENSEEKQFYTTKRFTVEVKYLPHTEYSKLRFPILKSVRL
jgi:bifunctional non-homologous end joining protein LigD